MTPLKLNADLLKIYQKTFFEVKNSSGKRVKFTIRSLHKFPELSQKKFTVITAWNPMNKVLTKKQNRLRNRRLAHRLVQCGHVFYTSQGWFGSHREEGFTVEGISLAHAKQLACKFEQYAIFFNDYRGPRFIRCHRGPLSPL